MIRLDFNAGWSVGPQSSPFAALGGAPTSQRTVTLPYDAVRDLERSADSEHGSHSGYFPGGVFAYSKSFEVPEEWRRKVVLLDFEGVYRDAVVYINGDFAGQRPNGYAEFTIDAAPYLRYGQQNVVTVESRVHHDSRWYSGGGIIRPVHLVVADPVHIGLDGVRVETTDVSVECAVVTVTVDVVNSDTVTQTSRVHVELVRGDGVVVASGSVPVTALPGTTAMGRLRVLVENPTLWSPDTPDLHTARVRLESGDAFDTAEVPFGIRTLQLDAKHGLRINGERVDLRGACIHHDNGPLGAAGIARADERRIEILKAAGFNAVRSAHNPISRATLDACDRLGVLVMDELTDVWTRAKSSFDYSLSFPEWWQRDVESMVRKDRNHASVVFYSIGNEIFEVGSPIGSIWGRKLAEKVRELDPTRYVTNAINGMVAIWDRLPEFLSGMQTQTQAQATDVNTIMAQLEAFKAMVISSDKATAATEESAGMLDAVGFNYGDSRYDLDAERFPDRVLIGSESFGPPIGRLWELVESHPNVLGDFTWTGWDYLGEAGIGRVEYIDPATFRPEGTEGAYPYLVAGSGDIDITGFRRPLSYYRETVFGLRHEPYIAVQRPQGHGKPFFSTPWSWSDSVNSWTWDVAEGSPVTVEVYSDAAAVELLLDGSSLGIAEVGADKPCLAVFETTYRAGTLTAISRYADGSEASTSLRSAAGALMLQATIDREEMTVGTTDLVYVEIRLVDENGVLYTDRDQTVTVSVEGAAELAGIGSGRIDSEERFDAGTHLTYDGRALAIVRPTEVGDVTIRVASSG